MSSNHHCSACLKKLFSADKLTLGPMEVFRLVEDLRSAQNREIFMSELEKYCLYTSLPVYQASSIGAKTPLSSPSNASASRFADDSPLCLGVPSGSLRLNNGTTMTVIRAESYEMLVDVLRVYLRQANNASEFTQITHVYELSQRIGTNLCHAALQLQADLPDAAVVGMGSHAGTTSGSKTTSLLKRLSMGSKSNSSASASPVLEVGSFLGVSQEALPAGTIEHYHAHREQPSVLPLLPAIIEHETWRNPLLWLDCVDRLLLGDLKQVAAMRLTGSVPVIESFFRLDIKDLLFALVSNRIQSVLRLLERHEAVIADGCSEDREAGAASDGTEDHSKLPGRVRTDFLNGTRMLFHLPLWISSEAVGAGVSFADLLAGLSLRRETCLWLLDTCCKFYIAGVSLDEVEDQRGQSALGVTDVNRHNGHYVVYNNVYSVGFSPAQALLLAVCKYVQRLQYSPELKDSEVHLSADQDWQADTPEEPGGGAEGRDSLNNLLSDHSGGLHNHHNSNNGSSSSSSSSNGAGSGGHRGSARLSLAAVTSFFGGHRRRESGGSEAHSTPSTDVAHGPGSSSRLGNDGGALDIAYARVCVSCKRAMGRFTAPYTVPGTGATVHGKAVPVYTTTAIPCTTWDAVGAKRRDVATVEQQADSPQLMLQQQLNAYRVAYYPSVVCEFCFRLLMQSSSSGCSGSGSGSGGGANVIDGDDLCAAGCSGLTDVLCVGRCVVPIPGTESVHYGGGPATATTSATSTTTSGDTGATHSNRQSGSDSCAEGAGAAPLDLDSDAGSSTLGDYCFVEEETPVYSLFSLYNYNVTDQLQSNLPVDTPANTEAISTCVDTILANYQITISSVPYLPEISAKSLSFLTNNGESFGDDDDDEEEEEDDEEEDDEEEDEEEDDEDEERDINYDGANSYYIDSDADDLCGEGGVAGGTDPSLSPMAVLGGARARRGSVDQDSDVLFRDVLIQYADSLDEGEHGEEDSFVLSISDDTASERLTPLGGSFGAAGATAGTAPVPTAGIGGGELANSRATRAGPVATPAVSVGFPPALETFRTQLVATGIATQKVCGQDLTNLKPRQLYLDPKSEFIYWRDKSNSRSRLALSFFRSSRSKEEALANHDHALSLADVVALKEGHGDFASYISIYTNDVRRKCLILMVADKRDYSALLRVLASLIRAQKQQG